MKREYKINIGFGLLVVAVVFFVLLSSTIAGIVGDMIRIAILALVIGLSIHKLVLMVFAIAMIPKSVRQSFTQVKSTLRR